MDGIGYQLTVELWEGTPTQVRLSDFQFIAVAVGTVKHYTITGRTELRECSKVEILP